MIGKLDFLFFVKRSDVDVEAVALQIVFGHSRTTKFVVIWFLEIVDLPYSVVLAFARTIGIPTSRLSSKKALATVLGTVTCVFFF